MAERYTEEAHRANVIACIDAANFGSKVIETEHLLLGILREDMAFVNRFLIPEASVDSIRHLIQARVTVREMIPATSDISLGDEGNRVYSFAAEEAHLMGREQIGIEHLLLGLLREKNCLAAQLLREHGADLERIRKELATAPYQPLPREEKIRSTVEQMRKILASASQLPPRNPEESSDAMSRFVHYTEKARRTIFFARYEASQFFSPMIETEHLLLGVLREDRAHLDLYLPFTDSIATIRKQIEEHSAVREKSLPGERLPARMSFPLSDECERALAYAEGEAANLSGERVGPEHLLLGLLREEGSFAAQLLREHGAEIERIRSGLKASQNQPPSNPADPSEPAA
jgi:ATP-dependent Clp protease ATP-binding subunit ClpA